jgi:beta,beta-carotene 9',10'-dioxygenase
MEFQGHRLMTSRFYASAFDSQSKETEETELKLTGKLPDWLCGNLIRTGPSLFSVNGESFNHLFDGLAMLHKFTFANGKMKYRSRFLESSAYRAAMTRGRVSSSEFGTSPRQSLLERIASISRFKPTDNANVNIACIGSHWLSLTEPPIAIEFNAETLATIGQFKFPDSLKGHVSTAHPHIDLASKQLFNILVEYGPKSSYKVYSVNLDGNLKRVEIARIRTSKPGYVHSFALTPNYVVLVVGPFVVNPLELILSGKPFVECFSWRPELGTRIYAIERHTGSVIETVAEPLFLFHHVNAFEDGNKISVDMLVYNDASIVESFYLDFLKAGSGIIPTPRPVRYSISPSKGTATSEIITQAGMELPRINYWSCNTRPYRYVYAAAESSSGKFLDQLVKLDLARGGLAVWKDDFCYPGEPVFAACPQSEEEDSGVLLSIVFNAQSKSSFLLILDAASMEELSRAPIPHMVPFGFHGYFTEENRI